MRLANEVSRHAGKAAAAESITARASSTVANATVPVTAPVAGLVTEPVRVPVPANGLPSDQCEIVDVRAAPSCHGGFLEFVGARACRAGMPPLWLGRRPGWPYKVSVIAD